MIQFGQNSNSNSNSNTAVLWPVAPTAVITDAFDNAIQAGDLIVFAVRKASNMWLNKLKVTGVTPTSVRGYDPEDVSQRVKTLKQTKTMVVLESAAN